MITLIYKDNNGTQDKVILSGPLTVGTTVRYDLADFNTAKYLELVTKSLILKYPNIINTDDALLRYFTKEKYRSYLDLVQYRVNIRVSNQTGANVCVLDKYFYVCKFIAGRDNTRSGIEERLKDEEDKTEKIIKSRISELLKDNSEIHVSDEAYKIACEREKILMELAARNC